MKKFILLILILPLILNARPEKKWLQIPSASHFGSVHWQVTTNCEWSTTSSTYSDLTDDDCDDNNRTIRGFYNTTDGTCSDGSGNGCDGAYPRIKFSKMPRGYYLFVVTARFAIVTGAGSGSRCSVRIYDGTTSYSQQAIEFNPHASTQQESNGTINFKVYHSKDQGAKTYNFQMIEDANGTCYLSSRSANIEKLEIDVYYYPSFEDGRYIITK